jgi:hypothetical protein
VRARTALRRVAAWLLARCLPADALAACAMVLALTARSRAARAIVRTSRA